MILSKFLLISFEYTNELFIALSAGLPGTLVLIHHGLKTNQTARSFLVASLTLLSFMFVARDRRRSKPSRRKVILISGCDTGLGFSLAQHITGCGYTVFAGFFSLESEGAKQIKQSYDQNVISFSLDITKEESIKKAVMTLENFLLNNPKYSLYALINNAGVMVFGEFEWLTEKLIENQINVNLCGTMRLTKAFCPMLRKYQGRVITITSHCAQATLPGLSVYGATKAALAGWSDGLRVEQAKYGVKVVTFIPGSFPTESHIMSKQLSYVQEMHDNFTEEQHQFYSNYFKRYNIYLSYLSGPTVPKKLSNFGLYQEFDNALLEESPKPLYKVENYRYWFYHTLFKYSPYCLRDYFVTKFMLMPEYIPPQ
ncbi:unnamed protein product [Brassicogethes aeneus]|uniref:Estradiol 17-beta-dehydrogenase 2 n=1 Tax=Brassicogethes aeneus TaxID=1431903 RepID=A0A9P0FCL9_BRAAE|nr:unnamed protein product [Brassicogethes aeneus]